MCAGYAGGPGGARAPGSEYRKLDCWTRASGECRCNQRLGLVRDLCLERPVCVSGWRAVGWGRVMRDVRTVGRGRGPGERESKSDSGGVRRVGVSGAFETIWVQAVSN